MRVEPYTTAEAFGSLAPEWDALLPSSNSLAFFMRTTWQRIWWKHLHRGDLLILAVRDDGGDLIGVAPLLIETVDGQRVLGIVGCIDVTDYVDLVYHAGRESDLARAIWNFLCSPDAPTWDRIHFCNIPSASPTLELFAQLAREAGLTAEVGVEDVCPVIDLPGDYEQYLESLDKKQRHELRRKRRRAEAFPVETYTVGPEHKLDEEIEYFLRLMSLSTPQKAEFLRQRGHRDFFKEIGPALFDQHMLDLSFLVVEGHRVAAMWNFAYGDRMMLYNSGLYPLEYSILSPGIVLLTFNIEHSIKRGFKKYDFLQGDEEYKLRMGAQATTVHWLTISR